MQLGGPDCDTIAPCAPWCTVPESQADIENHPEWCCDVLDLDDPVHRSKAVWAQTVASSVLFRLSGMRFNGCCETTEYLCVREDDCGCPSLMCGTEQWRSRPEPSGNASTWINCRCKRDGCNCASTKRFRLPWGPVTSLGAILLNGDPVAGAHLVGGEWVYLPNTVDLSACFDPEDVAPVVGVFVDQGGNVAQLGAILATGWDGINGSGWLQSLWGNDDTISITAGDVGDTFTIIVAPNDEVTWPASWTAVDDTGSGTLTGNVYVAGTAATNRVKLTYTGTPGDIVATQHNPSSTGIAVIGGSSTELIPAKGLSVTWTHGQAPPPEGRNAACVLACELAKACVGAACQLPKRVQSVSRQGVSWTVMDPMEFLEAGKTGLYEVDLFLTAWPNVPATTVTFVEDVDPINFHERARSRW